MKNVQQWGLLVTVLVCCAWGVSSPIHAEDVAPGEFEYDADWDVLLWDGEPYATHVIKDGYRYQISTSLIKLSNGEIYPITEIDKRVDEPDWWKKSPIEETLVFLGKTVTSTNPSSNDHYDWLKEQIALLLKASEKVVIPQEALKYEIELDKPTQIQQEYDVYKSQSSSSVSATGTATNTLMTESVLPSFTPLSAQPAPAPAPQVTAVGSSSAVANLPQAGASAFSLDINYRSALRYEHTWFKNADVEAQRLGATLRAGWDWDNVSLNFNVPIDRVWFNGSLDRMDLTRVGIMASPRVWLMTEDQGNSLDLSFGINAFYLHTFMDDQNSYVRMLALMGATEIEREDPDHVGIGPFFSMQKSFDWFMVGAGAAWQRGFNIDGNTDFPSKGGPEDEVDIIQAGANVGVPIGDRWMINGLIKYSHTCDQEDDVDADYWTVGLGAAYLLKDKWSLDVNVQRNLGYEHADNIAAHIGLSWMF